MSRYVLGIDGGGSKTQLCLVDRDGSIVQLADTGGSNPHDNPEWTTAFAALRRDVGEHLADVRAATIGIGSYGESSAIDRLVEETLQALFPVEFLDIENDVYLAHDAAFLGRPGVVLIAGTGSMAVARSADGTRLRCGGWGVPVGDEGSGFWIGREALSLATRMLDGRTAGSAFADALVAAMLGEARPGQALLLEWLSRMGHARSQIAGISTFVDQLATGGDRDAINLLDRAADYLAEHVIAGRRAADLGDQGPWSLLGGLSRSTYIRTALINRLGSMTPPVLSPCGGAIWRAARRAGWDIDAAWIGRVADHLRLSESLVTR